MRLAPPGTRAGNKSTLTVRIEADRQVVFNALSDVAAASRLIGNRPPKRLDKGPLGRGAHWSLRFGLLFMQKVTYRLTEYDPPSHVARAIGGSISADLHYFLDTHGGATDVRLEIETRKVPWPHSPIDFNNAQHPYLMALKDRLERAAK